MNTAATQKHAPDIYVSAFETYCDSGRYSEVARQFGVSPSTAKRWSRIGGEIWHTRNAENIAAAIARSPR